MLDLIIDIRRRSNAFPKYYNNPPQKFDKKIGNISLR